MGNRANFVVIENGQWRLHYHHWAGYRMLDALIAGPPLALRYIAQLRRCDDEWLDEVWADGGALIDLDRRRLLFFGDELMTGIPERRAMLAVLPQVWAGYSVGWAYRGMAELADYVGYALRPPFRSSEPSPKLARGRHNLCHLVSLVQTDGSVRLWPLWWGRNMVWLGPRLLNTLPGTGQSRIRLGVFPESGVHIDRVREEVGMWTTRETADTQLVLPDLWAGWSLQTWGDRFEWQVDRCHGAIRIPDLDVGLAIDSARQWLRNRIFQNFEDTPATHVIKLAGILSGVAAGLEVSSDAVSGTNVRPTPNEWAAFDQACDHAKAAYTRCA